MEKQHLDIAKSYTNLADVNFYMSNYKTSKKYDELALDIKQKKLGNYHLEVALSYNNLGMVSRALGDYYLSIEHHRKALDIRLKKLGKEHVEVARSYNNLGVTYDFLGDYEAAKKHHRKALSIRLKKLGKEHIDVANSYNNLAMIHQVLGDYETAKKYLETAIAIIVKTLGKSHVYTAISYANIAQSYHYLGDYENAKKYNRLALEIRLNRLGKDHLDVANSYNNLSMIHRDMGDYNTSKKYLQQALNIRLKKLGKEHALVGRAYGNLAKIYFTLGDYTTSQKHLEQALEIILKKHGNGHIDVTDTYSNLAKVYTYIGLYEKADSLWHINIPENLKQLQSTYLFLSDNQRINYLKTVSPIHKEFYSFAMEHGTDSTKQLATNLLLNTKSLALDYGVNTKKYIEEINDDSLNNTFRELNILNNQIAKAETMSDKKLEKMGWNIAQKREKRDVLASELLQHPELRKKLNPETIEWQDIQNRLATNEASVDFIDIYNRKDSLSYYAIVISRDSISPQFVRIADENALSELLKPDKNERPNYIYKKQKRKDIYRTLWQPLEPYLEDIKTVHISSAGILHRVPFESLQDATNEFLATRHNFHYYFTIRDMFKTKPQKTTYKDMLLMGYILYDLDQIDKEDELIVWVDSDRNTRGGFQTLTSTLDEVVDILRTSAQAGIRTTVLTIDGPSEDTVQYYVRERAPSIIHFATHGVFLPPLEQTTFNITGKRDRLRAASNPLQRSALMLYGANETWTKGRPILGSGEDGILTALEVTALNLSKTNLVVLSACSTGLGSVYNTEGVFGLQRAFKLAGVENVVVSLWDVGDTATKELMIRFYKNLLEDKQDPATALRNAKHYRRVEDEASALDWAGFILIE